MDVLSSSTLSSFEASGSPSPLQILFPPKQNGSTVLGLTQLLGQMRVPLALLTLVSGLAWLKG